MTRQEQNAYSFILGYYREHKGLSPTYGEIATAVGLKSRSGAFRLVEQLERKGRVKRLYNVQRSIVPIETSCPHCGGEL